MDCDTPGWILNTSQWTKGNSMKVSKLQSILHTYSLYIYYFISINSLLYSQVPVQTNTDHSMDASSHIQILHGVNLPCSCTFVLSL